MASSQAQTTLTLNTSSFPIFLCSSDLSIQKQNWLTVSLRFLLRGFSSVSLVYFLFRDRSSMPSFCFKNLQLLLLAPHILEITRLNSCLHALQLFWIAFVLLCALILRMLVSWFSTLKTIIVCLSFSVSLNLRAFSRVFSFLFPLGCCLALNESSCCLLDPMFSTSVNSALIGFISQIYEPQAPPPHCFGRISVRASLRSLHLPYFSLLNTNCQFLAHDGSNCGLFAALWSRSIVWNGTRISSDSLPDLPLFSHEDLLKLRLEWATRLNSPRARFFSEFILLDSRRAAASPGHDSADTASDISSRSDSLSPKQID